MTLDRTALIATVGAVVASAADVEWRLVGTASSAMRGVDLPVADVDVLLRTRDGVDASFERLATRAETATPPECLADASQYFAWMVIDGVRVELSTVEIDTGFDTCECFGAGPWIHCDDVAIDGVGVPVVASELRLVTEVTRGRAEHVARLVEHLRTAGCDIVLVERGLRNAAVPPSDGERLVDALSC